MKHSFLFAALFVLVSSVAWAGSSACAIETIAPMHHHHHGREVAHPTTSGWEVELSAANWFAMRTMMGGESSKFNLAGPELTGVYSLDERHAFTLRGSAMWGRHSRTLYYSAPGYKYNFALPNDGLQSAGKLDLTLMPGYRYTMMKTEEWKVYVGANVGLIFTDVNKRHSYLVNLGGLESAWGAAAAVELGVNYALDKDWSLFASYLLAGDTARPTINGHKQKSQVYQGVRLGVGFQF